MRNRSPLLIFPALLVLWGGCVDYAEPTGPVPTPPPEDGGEITAPVAGTSADDLSDAARRARQLTEQTPAR
jgi:hypothetical protein